MLQEQDALVDLSSKGGANPADPQKAAQPVPHINTNKPAHRDLQRRAPLPPDHPLAHVPPHQPHTALPLTLFPTIPASLSASKAASHVASHAAGVSTGVPHGSARDVVIPEYGTVQGGGSKGGLLGRAGRIPRLVHQTWKGGAALPDDVAALVATWVSVNPGWQVRTLSSTLSTQLADVSHFFNNGSPTI